VSFILLRSLFYRNGRLIILPVSRVSVVQAMLLILMQVQMTIDNDPVTTYLGYRGV
jgi:hypothetical protein